MTLAVLLAMTISPTPASALPLARAFADPQVAVVATARRPSLLEILDAIRTVDVGAREHGDDTLGEFRIDRAYWRKADLKGKFEDCRDVRCARCVVVAYWRRWYPEALARCDAEVLARIHNGGPKGARKVSTRAYWQEVQRALGERSSRVH